MQMAIIPRPPVGHGWLRPAIGVVELSQSVVQVSFPESQYFSERSALVSTSVVWSHAYPFSSHISYHFLISFPFFQHKVRKVTFFRDNY